MAQESKTCRKCRKKKPVTCFYKDSSSPDGKNYWCKDCVKERQGELKSEKRKGKPGENVLKIDFMDHVNLYLWLEKKAKNELRTVEMQALYMLLHQHKEGWNGNG